MKPGIKEKMMEFLVENEYIRNLNVSITEYEDGYARGEMLVEDKHLNPYHSVHGGALYSLADIVSGCAACQNGRYATTVSGTMSFLKPAIHTRKVVCEARVVHNGKTISVYEVKLLDDKGELLETGTFTFYHMNREVLPETEA